MLCLEGIYHSAWKFAGIDAFSEKNILQRLDLYYPDSKKDTISVLCNVCSLVLFDNVGPGMYEIDMPAQPNYSIELFLDGKPCENSLMETEPNMFNCKNNCHSPLYLIDANSGLFPMRGYPYTIACGRSYANIVKYDPNLILQNNKHIMNINDNNNQNNNDNDNENNNDNIDKNDNQNTNHNAYNNDDQNDNENSYDSVENTTSQNPETMEQTQSYDMPTA